ncbi:DUF484 family protein [Teredinibacter purpureus]|uniref:DUF484 family protein n=1 Tax=Teredinibacter purpureus TaxID=2731756 RepID=UPI0005F7B05B|nr:DUF484 family protein [Teredinibacter purpureus]
MSESSITQNREKISDEQVAQYLKKHPDFFNRHIDLLADLDLPHQSGPAVSLVERQVAILRDRNMDMRHRLSQLLDNARDNDRLFDKTKRLVLALLECNDLGDLVDALYYSFDKEFNIHYTRLILFGNNNTPVSEARIVSIHDARDYIGKRLKLPNTVSGGIDVKESGFLFDGDAPNIGSAAIAVLQHGSPLGVLAIGNQDPNYYRSSMGTLFLSYIAEVLNRQLPKYLK